MFSGQLTDRHRDWRSRPNKLNLLCCLVQQHYVVRSAWYRYTAKVGPFHSHINVWACKL